MSGFDPADGLEVLSADQDNVVARHGNLAVQVRTGELTQGALERIGSLGRLLLKRTDGPIGAVSVLEATAEPAGPAIRARQRETIGALLEDPRARLAVVIAGEGVVASLQRTVARMMVPGRATIADDASNAARVLAAHLRRPATEIEAVVDHVRAIARAERGSAGRA